jgi:hypothetical protein
LLDDKRAIDRARAAFRGVIQRVRATPEKATQS